MDQGEFACVTELGERGSSVMDVAWRGYNGLMADLIASASDDGLVSIWKCDLPQ